MLFRIEMAKFGPLVADPLAVNQETSMLKTPKTLTKNPPAKLVTVIKNGHTDAELDEMEERWANRQGPRLTLADVVAIEQTKQKTQDAK